MYLKIWKNFTKLTSNESYEMKFNLTNAFSISFCKSGIWIVSEKDCLKQFQIVKHYQKIFFKTIFNKISI